MEKEGKKSVEWNHYDFWALSTQRWASGVSKYLTVPTSSSMIFGAVRPLPSFAYAFWVAILTIEEANAGPYSKFQ